MNIKLVFKILLILLSIVSVFMIFPLMFSYYYHDGMELAFVVPAFLGILGGTFAMLFLKTSKEQLTKRDGFLLVTLAWVFTSFFGSLPYMLGVHMSLTNAFFETMSGFTTTGASILTDIEAMPKSILFWRSLTHWLGGMGIVVLSVAILPMLGIGGIQLIKAESPGPTMEKITPRIAQTAKYLWGVYLLLSIVETLLLLAGGMNLFDALTHTFGTMATGGFSTKNTSIAYFHSAYIDWVIIVFMFLAGANFSIHFRLLTGRFKSLLDDELRFYTFIVVAAVLLVSVDLLNQYGNFFSALRYGAFQVVSIMTTTGYVTANYEKWPHLAQMVLFLLMFVGSCSGSTGGSVKVIRIYTLLKQAINELKYHIHPKGVFALTINKQPVRKNIVYSVSGFFFLYMATFFLVALSVSMFGVDLITSLSASAATLGNIGPGFGNVGPVDNYAHLPVVVKWILSFAMLVGRLEIYTVFVIFAPAFWRK